MFIYLDNKAPSNKLNETLVESQALDLNITDEDLKSSGIYIKKRNKFCIIILYKLIN